MLDEVGMPCHDALVEAVLFPPAWNGNDKTDYGIGITKSSGDSVVQPAAHDDLIEDAKLFALSFGRDFRALHQLNHDHDSINKTLLAEQHKSFIDPISTLSLSLMDSRIQ